MSALREVFVKFTSQFDGKGLAQANRATKTTIGDLNVTNQAFGRLGSLFGPLGSDVSSFAQGLGGVGIAAAGAAVAILGVVAATRAWLTALYDVADEVRGIGDDLDKTSRRFGIDVSSLQALRHAAGLAGIETAQLDTALSALTQALRGAAASSTSEQARTFQRLGVSIRDANGDLRPMGELINDLAGPLSQMESTTARNVALTTLFGEQGSRLGVLFENGSEGIAQARAEIEALGGGMSGAAVGASAMWTDSMARLDLAILSVKSSISELLIPIFDMLTKALTETVAWLARNEWAMDALKFSIIAITAGLGALLGVIAVGLATIILPFVLGLGLLLAGFLLLLSPLALLVLVFEDLYTWIVGGDSVIGTLIESLLSMAGISLDPLKEAFRDLWDFVSGVFDDIVEQWNAIASALGLAEVEVRGSAKGTGATPTAPGSASAAAADEPFLVRLQRETEQRNEANTAARIGGAKGVAIQSTQNNQININGATDPEAVGREVQRHLNRLGRQTSEALG